MDETDDQQCGEPVLRRSARGRQPKEKRDSFTYPDVTRQGTRKRVATKRGAPRTKAAQPESKKGKGEGSTGRSVNAMKKDGGNETSRGSKSTDRSRKEPNQSERSEFDESSTDESDDGGRTRKIADIQPKSKRVFDVKSSRKSTEELKRPAKQKTVKKNAKSESAAIGKNNGNEKSRGSKSTSCSRKEPIQSERSEFDESSTDESDDGGRTRKIADIQPKSKRVFDVKSSRKSTEELKRPAKQKTVKKNAKSESAAIGKNNGNEKSRGSKSTSRSRKEPNQSERSEFDESSTDESDDGGRTRKVADIQPKSKRVFDVKSSRKSTEKLKRKEKANRDDEPANAKKAKSSYGVDFLRRSWLNFQKRFQRDKCQRRHIRNRRSESSRVRMRDRSGTQAKDGKCASQEIKRKSKEVLLEEILVSQMISSKTGSQLRMNSDDLSRKHEAKRPKRGSVAEKGKCAPLVAEARKGDNGDEPMEEDTDRSSENEESSSDDGPLSPETVGAAVGQPIDTGANLLHPNYGNSTFRISREEWENWKKTQNGSRFAGSVYVKKCSAELEKLYPQCTFQAKDHNVSTRSSDKKYKGGSLFRAKFYCKASKSTKPLGKKCSMAADLIMQEPYLVHVHFTGKCEHEPGQFVCRNLTGKERKATQERLLDGAAPHALHQEMMSNIDPRKLTSGSFRENKHVYAQAKFEVKKKQREDCTELVSIHRLKEAFVKEDEEAASHHDSAIAEQQHVWGFIQFVGTSPLHVTAITYLGVRILHDLARNGIYIDATGTIVKDFEGRKTLLYEISVQNPVEGPNLPVAHLLTNYHTQTAVQTFILHLKHIMTDQFGYKTFPTPTYVYSDQSIVFLMASLEVYNRETVPEWLDRCYDLLSGDAVESTFKENACIPLACFSHSQKNFSDKLKKLKVKKSSRQTILLIMRVICKTTNLKELRSLLKKLCIILMSEFESKRVLKAKESLGKAYDQLSDEEKGSSLNPEPESETMEREEFPDDSDDSDTESLTENQSVASAPGTKFSEFANDIVREVRRLIDAESDSDCDDSEDKEKNELYCPKFATYLMTYKVPNCPWWTSLMRGDLSRHGTTAVYDSRKVRPKKPSNKYNKAVHTTGAQEQRFYMIKEIDMKRVLRWRVDDFLRALGDKTMAVQKNGIVLAFHKVSKKKLEVSEESWSRSRKDGKTKLLPKNTGSGNKAKGKSKKRVTFGNLSPAEDSDEETTSESESARSESSSLKSDIHSLGEQDEPRPAPKTKKSTSKGMADERKKSRPDSVDKKDEEKDAKAEQRSSIPSPRPKYHEGHSTPKRVGEKKKTPRTCKTGPAEDQMKDPNRMKHKEKGKKVESDDAEIVRIVPKFSGTMENAHSNCWFNCLCQALVGSGVVQKLSQLKKLKHHEKRIINVLNKLEREGNIRTAEIEPILKALSGSFEYHAQNDAHAFLMDTVGPLLMKDMDTKHMAGMDITYSIKCQTCPPAIRSPKTKMGVTLDLNILPTHPSVEQALIDITSADGDYLKGYKCYQCGAVGQSKQSMAFDFPPQCDLIFFMINRFTPEGKKLMLEIVANEQISIRGKTFKLHAQIIHRGNTATVGHYVTLRHEENGIFLCDDQLKAIVPASERDLQSSLRESYILIYRVLTKEEKREKMRKDLKAQKEMEDDQDETPEAPRFDHGIVDKVLVEQFFPGTWLGDDVVNGYINQCIDERILDHSAVALPSQYYQKRCKGEDWALKHLGDLSVPEVVLLPICGKNHWVLASFHNDDKTIRVWNSSKGIRPELDVLLDYAVISKFRHSDENPWTMQQMKCPQQQNSSDCGVYVLHWARGLITGTPTDGAINSLELRRLFKWEMSRSFLAEDAYWIKSSRKDATIQKAVWETRSLGGEGNDVCVLCPCNVWNNTFLCRWCYEVRASETDDQNCPVDIDFLLLKMESVEKLTAEMINAKGGKTTHFNPTLQYYLRRQQRFVQDPDLVLREEGLRNNYGVAAVSEKVCLALYKYLTEKVAIRTSPKSAEHLYGAPISTYRYEIREMQPSKKLKAILRRSERHGTVYLKQVVQRILVHFLIRERLQCTNEEAEEMAQLTESEKAIPDSGFDLAHQKLRVLLVNSVDIEDLIKPSPLLDSM